MPEQPFSPPLIADTETPAVRGRLSARSSASRRGRSGPRSLSASGLKRTAWLHVVALSGADKEKTGRPRMPASSQGLGNVGRTRTVEPIRSGVLRRAGVLLLT